MGNPAAPVKVVEYGSMTCPHCADFSRTAMTPLAARFIRSGKVSFEFRNFVLNGVDVAASLLARCGGPTRFFPVTERMFATQKSWVDRFKALGEADREQLTSLPPEQSLGRIAELIGLTQIAAGQGVPTATAKRCLADKAALDRLTAMREAGAALGLHGTPAFLINGKVVEAHDWQELEALISKAAS
jgi:protein-disulfide isomerase